MYHLVWWCVDQYMGPWISCPAMSCSVLSPGHWRDLERPCVPYPFPRPQHGLTHGPPRKTRPWQAGTWFMALALVVAEHSTSQTYILNSKPWQITATATSKPHRCENTNPCETSKCTKKKNPTFLIYHTSMVHVSNIYERLPTKNDPVL